MLMLEKMDELSLTQKALAERMGCTQQYVSKILRGKENLSIETLSKIESALSLRLFTY
jgi:DNA-binding helix-turn-helix protein